MSASREKKARQEFAASGAVDPKAARQAEERAKQRRNNWLYGGIAIVFVLVAAVLLVWNSNVIQRGASAVTVEGETYSAAEVSYFYHVAYNSIAQSQYASYYGLSKSTPLTQQSLSDMAKTLLGVSDDMTWDAYFRDAAKKSLIQITMLKKGAAEKNITWNDDMQKELDSTMETLATYAKSAGKSEGEYLKQLYGSNMTKKIFQGILKDTIIASHYQQDYIDSLQYTDEELQKYYEENKNSFDVANYEMITFNGAAASTKDADGNTVQPTEEESAAALQKAKDAANAALEQVKGGELLAKVAKDYEPIGTYSHPEAGTYSGDAATKWVFDESRQEGDTEIVENGTSIYLLVFHSRTRNDYNTVDVRHILFKVDTTGLDSKVEDYQAKLEELKAGKKQEAENALQAWKDAGGGEEFRNAIWPLYTTGSSAKLWNGRFEAPSAGAVSLAYGTTQMVDGQRSGQATGLTYAAADGETVTAPQAGNIVFAGTLTLTGGTVVIDHGCGVKSYLYGLETVGVVRGQSVSPGDPLGAAGTSHSLIYELRIGSKSTDPQTALDGNSGLQFREAE